jgi:hypothetical protein
MNQNQIIEMSFTRYYPAAGSTVAVRDGSLPPPCPGNIRLDATDNW